MARKKKIDNLKPGDRFVSPYQGELEVVGPPYKRHGESSIVRVPCTNSRNRNVTFEMTTQYEVELA